MLQKNEHTLIGGHAIIQTTKDTKARTINSTDFSYTDSRINSRVDQRCARRPMHILIVLLRMTAAWYVYVLAPGVFESRRTSSNFL